ncbi:MAG: HD domain-containing phosphohydrolase [bacterium]
MENEFLSLHEVANILGVKPLTIHRMIHRGEIRATKMGRDWRFEKNEPERYLKEQESNSLLFLGMKHKSTKSLDKAIDCFKESTRIYPQNKKAHLELAKIYFENRKKDEMFYKWANARLEKVLELDTENIEAFSLLQKIGRPTLSQAPTLESIFKEKINQLSSFAKDIDKESHGFSEHTHNTARALSEMVNTMDAYSKGHSDKKAIYAAAIGHRLGLPQPQLEFIQIAAFLYDIGKIKIDKEILLKPGRLTQEELEVVKTHPKLGAEILKEAGLPEEIFLSALFHHESVDGKGYPHGLSGDEIPLSARIIKAIDIFSALISERPYRKPLSFDESMNELRKASGSVLDTNVVNVFLDVLSEDRDWIFKSSHPNKNIRFPIRKILIVDHDMWNANAIKGSLELNGFGAITARTGEDALQKIYEISPNLIIIESLLPDINGYALCKRLSADRRSSHIPIIILSNQSDVAEEITLLESGADYYMAKPFDLKELLTQIKALLRRVEQERSVSPLTGLPGTLSIEEEIIKRVMNFDKKFEVMDLDLDNFKVFNDVYGFLQGDEVIKLVAKILIDTFEKFGSNSDFIGHIGGDDFVAVTTPEHTDNICQEIISQFDARIKDLYHKEDLERGYIISKNRNHKDQKFPILTISIGCVSNLKRKITSHWEIGKIVSEVKEYAKSRQGSNYHRNMRVFEGVKI